MKKYILFLFSLAIVFSSCLKDTGNNYANKPSGTPNIVQFATSTLGTWKNSLGFNFKSVTPSTVPVIVELYAELQSSDASLKTSTVTIAKTPALVAIYDSANAASYEVLPDSTYQLVSTTAQVAPNNIATFQLKLFANKIDLSKSYALGFTLVSATGATIASNRSTVVIGIGVKNIYDGIYKLNGYILRATDAAKTGFITNKEYSLITTGAATVRMFENHLWADLTGIAATVSNPTYSIDPVTNLVTITTPEGGPFPGGQTNLAGFISRYDPLTKTIYAYSTWGGGPGVREMRDTLVYQRPR